MTPEHIRAHTTYLKPACEHTGYRVRPFYPLWTPEHITPEHITCVEEALHKRALWGVPRALRGGTCEGGSIYLKVFKGLYIGIGTRQ
jgi:hypothetical protein